MHPPFIETAASILPNIKPSDPLTRISYNSHVVPLARSFDHGSCWIDPKWWGSHSTDTHKKDPTQFTETASPHISPEVELQREYLPLAVPLMVGNVLFPRLLPHGRTEYCEFQRRLRTGAWVPSRA